MTDALDRVVRYHEGTKHHYHRFARSLGYMDWDSQPSPFRSFTESRVVPLFPAPGAEPLDPVPARTYDSLYENGPLDPLAIALPSIGFFLRHALGLSAWKAFASSRWSLRVNPSSGNLHPTEAYVLAGDRVWHYDAEHHAAEERCVFDAGAWAAAGVDQQTMFLVALTSIHWRESWKYGERAFRYCHHDAGHAIGALRLSATLCGWHLEVLRGWTHAQMAALTGVDRDGDFFEAEREEPACVMAVATMPLDPPPIFEPAVLARAVRSGSWAGRASQLSQDHVQWTFIDEVAGATTGEIAGADERSSRRVRASRPVDRGLDAGRLILRRRSAVALDARTALTREAFLAMMARLMPDDAPPWDALWWRPRIHLALFVHRVLDFETGLYLLVRDAAAQPLLRTAISTDASWIRVSDDLPLWQLATGDCRRLSQRVSCDQDIAADGCFSLGMIAEFSDSLGTHGASFYRNLFWECGLIGQVLYLEAEAAGIRGTGIGCFYDDGMHDALGLTGHRLQSLYHFTMGGAVHDDRITTLAGYSWGG